jgi:hypothetical protein
MNRIRSIIGITLGVALVTSRTAATLDIYAQPQSVVPASVVSTSTVEKSLIVVPIVEEDGSENKLSHEEFKIVWEADEAEVARLRALNDAGATADSFAPYALLNRAELLEEISRVVEIEAYHYEMNREELVVRVSTANIIQRAFSSDESEFNNSGYFEWVRDEYTEQDIAVYEELGAPQWLINRLIAEIATR